MGIASLVAQVNPEKKELILKELSAIQGVEVVQNEDPKSWILLVDIENETLFVETLKNLQQYPHFMSISYASHYTEDAI